MKREGIEDAPIQIMERNSGLDSSLNSSLDSSLGKRRVDQPFETEEGTLFVRNQPWRQGAVLSHRFAHLRDAGGVSFRQVE
jgi:hypothetical protein